MKRLHVPDPRREASGAKRSLVAALALLILTSAAHADESQAREVLKAVTDYLAAQPNLSFDVDSSVEVVTTDDQKLTIASSGSVVMQRPDEIRPPRRGGFSAVEMVSDGKTLSVRNQKANTCAQSGLPDADAGEVLLADMIAVTSLGSGALRGQECDHLAFRTDAGRENTVRRG